MAEVKAKYKCTENELYSIMNLAINNLESDLARFTAKSTNYNPALIVTLRGLRTTAMALPDEEARNGVHQNLGNQLPVLVEPVKQDFNDLKGYIRAGWPTEKPEPRYEQAGLVHYNKIGLKNWENVESLHTSMRNFITLPANNAKLITPGGMLAGFALQADTNFGAFKTVYDAFLSSRETGTATAAKLNANNTLYDQCMLFMTFGVESVFRTDEDAKKRYTFTSLKDIVSPPGSASLKVTVKRKITNVPVEGAQVTIQSSGAVAQTKQTDVTGVAVFNNIDPADYNVVIVVTGAPNINVTKEVNTGVDARMELEVD